MGGDHLFASLLLTSFRCAACDRRPPLAWTQTPGGTPRLCGFSGVFAVVGRRSAGWPVDGQRPTSAPFTAYSLDRFLYRLLPGDHGLGRGELHSCLCTNVDAL